MSTFWLSSGIRRPTTAAKEGHSSLSAPVPQTFVAAKEEWQKLTIAATEEEPHPADIRRRIPQTFDAAREKCPEFHSSPGASPSRIRQQAQGKPIVP